MSALGELRSIVGDAEAREAEATDAIDGVRPALVVRPGSVEEVSRVMSLASRMGLRVAPRGGGTQLGLGNPPERLDLILDLSRLDRILEHAAGDLVVSTEAGVRLRTLQVEVARAGQMLALDPAGAGATVGGIVAANASGPRRFRYGTARDLLIGVTVVLADGTVAKAGGKVVKNVAGYDLAKLMTGSLGTLAVIVRTVFRLHPLPRAQRLVEAELSAPQEVESAVQHLLHSALVPSAIQLCWPAAGAPRVGVLFEGEEPSVVAQAATAVESFGALAAPVVREGEQVEARWRDLLPTPVSAADVEIRITGLPARLAELIGSIREIATRGEREPHLTGMLGNGILDLRMEGIDPEEAVKAVRELRARTSPGNVVLRAAPLEVKRRIDVWGPVGDSLDLMRRVKDRFDPDHLLNPGRFVGGI